MPHHFGHSAEPLNALVFKDRNPGSAPINETNDAAKTYDDPGRHGHDALAPALRTGPDLAAVVEAWPGLPRAVKAGIVAIVTADAFHNANTRDTIR